MQTATLETTKTREISYDLLRLLALFSMMLLHVAGAKWNSTPNTGNWLALHVYNGISRFCVPVFVMISGKFLLAPEKEYALQELFKKAFRLMTAFLFWSMLYAAARTVFAYEAFHLDSIRFFLKALFSGHYHMWYLFMLAGLYLIVPFLKPIAENRKLTGYFILLSLIFQSGVTLISALEIPFFSALITETSEKIMLTFVSGYPALFLSGRYLSETVFTRGKKLALYTVGIFSLVFTIAISAWISLKSGVPNESFFSFFQPAIIFTSAAIFVFAGESFPKRLPKKVQSFLKKTASLSLGMYLCHDLILKALHYLFGFDSSSFCAVFSVPVVTLAVFSVSFLITYAISFVPILKRWIL